MAERLTPTDEWRVTWEGHREDQLDLFLSATPTQRLRWLEEMLQIAWSSGALPRPTEESRET
jgi:hypothetical protein